MGPIDLATAIITAVREAATAYYKWLEGRDARRMEAAINAGENYIFANEDTNWTDKERVKLLKKYRKLFFKYN